MSINRWDASVDLNQAEIVRALKLAGASVEVIRKPLDLLVGYDRRTYILEVKAPKGRTSSGQDDFMRNWKGDVACVVRNVSEALAVIGCETRGVEIGHRVPVTSPWLDGTSTGGSSNEAG